MTCREFRTDPATALGMRALLVLVLLTVPTLSLAREVPITIIHTTDVHGHVLPAYDYDGNESVGGMLRAATLIRELRQNHDNTLLVDCGDLIQGSPESLDVGGRIMVDVLSELKYDAWVIGNHEFDWGIENLQELHDHSKTDMLGGNIYSARPAENPLPLVKPFVIKEVSGVRIALIGLTTPGIPSWSWPTLLGGLLFRDSLESLDLIMPLVREESPDVLVLLLHQGYKPYGDDFANQVSAIARAYPELDVIIGGHTHRVVEDVRINDILYTQAGYHANWVGEVSLVFDTVSNLVTHKSGVVHLVGDQFPEDPSLTAVFSEHLENVASISSQPLGRCEIALSTTSGTPGHSPQQALISEAIASACRVDFVVHGALDDREVPPGTVTEKDLWKIVPYENRIGILHLTSKEIKAVLEENAAKARSRHFMGVHGLCYDLHIRAKVGGRVKHLRLPNGKPLNSRKRYKVAFNSYVLASAGQRSPVIRALAGRPETRLDLTKTDTRSAVRRFIKKKRVIQKFDDACVEMIKSP